MFYKIKYQKQHPLSFYLVKLQYSTNLDFTEVREHSLTKLCDDAMKFAI